jgi:hypothetical protein
MSCHPENAVNAKNRKVIVVIFEAKDSREELMR